MIRVEQLNKTYDKRSRLANQALYDISFSLPDTGFVCIVGQSGCGKTTLLNTLGGLDTFDDGCIRTDTLSGLRCGTRQTEELRNSTFGYIFQNYYLLPQYSAAYNVYLALHSLELSHGEKLKRVMEALRTVDMDRFARRPVGQLSGGQQQRVAIARALARRPRVIFADEPTGNLDEANTISICSLLRRISRSSLVIMVTHEERIARFFADRIIRLESGRILEDSNCWQRDGLAMAGGQLYTEELAQSTTENNGVNLRLLRSEDAPPVNLTVVAQRDRIIIKLDDPRTVSCGAYNDSPQLIEGSRPVLSLETLDQTDVDMMWEETAQPARAGSGLRLPMLIREAKNLMGGKGLRKLGSLFFLIVLTVLVCLAVGDYLKVASIQPEDFILTDSHILELNLERGALLNNNTPSIQNEVYEYTSYLDSSGLDFDYIPRITNAATYSTAVFLQMGNQTESLGTFSYAPLSRFDPSTLMLGRMPETAEEIVVDRWILDAMLQRDGILQNGISDVSYFLGRNLEYFKKNYTPVIVGICDSGEPTIYMDTAGLISLGTRGVEVMSLSQLQAAIPGVYDDLTLADHECLMVTTTAGISYEDKVGHDYITPSQTRFTIAGTIDEEIYPFLIVADSALDDMLYAMINANFYLYCADKSAMQAFIAQPLPEHLDQQIQVFVTDKHSDSMAEYEAATKLRTDGRSIVTLSVIVLSLLMLYLLQRSRIQERIGLVAVYRLLGIPGTKLAVIFALECLLMYLISTLPTAFVVWLVVTILTASPAAECALLLPWYAAGGISLGIFVFHLVVSLLPLHKLLRQPPARLAAKYDL